MSGTVRDLLTVARGEIGVRETGGGARGNRQRYSVETGLPVTEWCAIFVSWCLRRAQVPRAYAATRVTLFARHYAGVGRFVRAPHPGDIVCYDWGMDGAFDHTGFVERLLPDGRIQTIEGNTNPGNGQDGVYRMVRSTRNVRGYCRPHYRGARQYVVRTGDTLSAIGTREGVAWQAVAALNGVSPPYVIRPGQVLQVPSAAPAPPPAFHTVARGQTLAGIAQKYHLTTADILRLNPRVHDPDVVHPNDRIRLR